MFLCKALSYQFKSFSYFHLISVSPPTSLNTDLSRAVKRRSQFPAFPFGRKDAIPSFRLACHSSSGLDDISTFIFFSRDLSTFFTPRNFHRRVISSNGSFTRSPYRKPNY